MSPCNGTWPSNGGRPIRISRTAGSAVALLRDRLLALWNRPASFLAGLLLLNAVFLPFRERYHDALLYEFQVLNQVQDGRFADDIYLRFGSQDSYSVFSRVAAPLASAFGVPATFFALYLACRTLFFWAAMRLMRTLFPESLVAALGLLALAVYDLPLGGLDVFHVNENFFTPRLLAMTLTLFALERMLAGRIPAALLMLLLSVLVHPLMGFGGLLLFTFWYMRCGAWRGAAAVLLSLVGMAVLTVVLTPSIGFHVFGEMDSMWRAQVRARLGVVVASAWTSHDWIDALASTAIALLAWRLCSPEPRLCGFLAALSIVTVFAALGTILTAYVPYALLLQGQPFRAFWLIQTLRIPLCLTIAQCLWGLNRTAPRISAALLVSYCLGPPNSLDLALALGLFVPVLLTLRRARATGYFDTLPMSVAGSLAGGVALGTAFRWGYLIGDWSNIVPRASTEQQLYFFCDFVDPACRAVLGTLILLALARLLGHERRFRYVALLLCLSIQSAAVALGRIDGSQSEHNAATRLVKQVVETRGPPSPTPPTVYWATNRVDRVWFGLGVNSYFSFTQLGGNVFSRLTAMEGRRRAALVAPFEIDLARRRTTVFGPREQWELEQLYGVGLNAAAPTVHDLLRLCADAELDFIVTRQRFSGLYAASAGAWFIYDCSTVRSRREFSQFVGARWQARQHQASKHQVSNAAWRPDQTELERP